MQTDSSLTNLSNVSDEQMVVAMETLHNILTGFLLLTNESGENEETLIPKSHKC